MTTKLFGEKIVIRRSVSRSVRCSVRCSVSRSVHSLLLTATVVTFGSVGLRAEEWNQFRGSDFGRTSESQVAELWNSDAVAWKTPLPGRGSSCPVVFKDRAYVTAYTGFGIRDDAPGNPGDLVRHLFCINLSDGSIVWQKDVPAPSHKAQYNNWGVGVHGYASSTPAVDPTGVYVYFAEAGLIAFDFDGNQRWQADCGSKTHSFGSGNSPVLYKDTVIVNASVESGDLIAINKSDGSEVWRQGGMSESWNSPVVYKNQNNKDELALSIKGKILAFDPNTGERLWSCAGVDDYICPNIIVEDGVLYAGGGRRSRLIAVRSGGSGDVTDSHKIWDIVQGSNVSSPVYHQGHVYWAREKGGLVYCVDAQTGETNYKQRLDPSSDLIYASPLLADGRLYYVSRKNGIFTVAATPEFKLLSHTNLDGDDSIFNASPVMISDGSVLLRSDKFLYRLAPQE